MRRTFAVSSATSTALLAALIAAPAAAQDTDPGYVPELDADFAPTTDGDGDAVSVVLQGIEGEAGPDDHAWKLEYPSAWDTNGFVGTKELVLYAHGFVGPFVPGTTDRTPLVAQEPPGRALLPANGLAWAASSYSANNYTIDKPVDETEDMIRIFTEETGHTPDIVYIYGISMGGHVTGVAVERYPGTFAGALPVCGVMGDQALFDYYGNANLLGQALTGQAPDDAEIPANYLDPGDASATPPRPPGPGAIIVGGLGLNDELNPGGYVLGQAVEQLTGGERPLGGQAWEFWNSRATDLVPGLPFLPGVIGGALAGGPDNRTVAKFDNTETVYQLDGDASLTPLETMLNAIVTRDAATSGASYTYPRITGDVGTTKVLTMHTLGDLFVPFSMQQEYARRVADEGKADQLVQRAIRGLAHCAFTGEEIGTALTDLLTWVATDIVPEGDDLLDPEVVARRTFGCEFTINGANPPADRVLVPSCETAAAPPAARVAGEDRAATALAAASASHVAPSTVILASEDGFADALAAAPLAGALEAPILLTDGRALDEDVAAYLTDSAATTVILVGGEAALSAEVFAAAEAAVAEGTAERLSGDDRYATAAAVANRVMAVPGANATSVFVVRGDGFADAVAVSGLAAFTRTPVLLTRPAELPAATVAALTAAEYAAATIVGGTSAVSADVADNVDELAGTVTRLDGATRYETSAALVAAQTAAGMDVRSPWLATGRSFADALSAGPAAASQGQVFGLVDGQVPTNGAPVVDLLRGSQRVEEVNVVGGEAAVSTATEDFVVERVDRRND